MSLYLAGPMTGITDKHGNSTHNYPAFHAAAADLRARGHTVVSPAELHPHAVTNPQTWEDYMRADLRALLGTDAVVVLPGWEHSKGARLEVTIAKTLGMLVWEYEPRTEVDGQAALETAV